MLHLTTIIPNDTVHRGFESRLKTCYMRASCTTKTCLRYGICRVYFYTGNESRHSPPPFVLGNHSIYNVSRVFLMF